MKRLYSIWTQTSRRENGIGGGMTKFRWIGDVLRDVRHVARMIRTKPRFSVPALLSLALGIGANIAIFSVSDAVLIRPLPYPGSGALVAVSNRIVIQGQVFNHSELSSAMYAVCKGQATAFEDFGVWASGAATITGIGDPEQLVTIKVTQGVLPALGVPAHVGRWFSSEDDSPGTPQTVILSDGYWQRRFGGDPAVIGRTILIDFTPREVIGVMPPEFRFLNLSPDIFLPQRFPKGGLSANELSWSGIARIRPGVTLALANEDVARVWKIWGEEEKVRTMLEMLKVQPSLHPLKDDVVGDVGSILTFLMGALGLVLLLVCANVANLALVRAQSRQQEFAVRAALGAGWGRIARELLVESLALGTLGGGLGLAFAYVALRILVARGPATLPRLAEISLDGNSLAFALACSLGSGLLFGLATIARFRIPARIRSTRATTAGGNDVLAQNALVVTQLALAFVLLVASGLMVRTFVALQAVKPGFTKSEQIQTVRLSIPEALVADPGQAIRTQYEIVERISALPGVTAVGFASALPMESEYRNGILTAVEGKIYAGDVPPNRLVRNISPGLLAAQGTRMVAGRDLAWEDVFDQRRIALVSENMARENWGEPANALGKRIRLGRDGPWTEVVGVVEDIYADGVNQPAPATVYLRMGVDAAIRVGGPSTIRRSATYAIRTERAGTEAFLREIATAIHAANANLPLAKVRTLSDVYRQSMARTSLTLVLLGIAGAMALALAIIGIYGVLAYAVAQRRREVGIRLALGARPRALKWLFVRRGLTLTLHSAVVGLALAGSLSRWISSLLFRVTGLDPITYALAGALVVAAAITASYVPAREAASVDPMETLRSE